MLSYAVFVMLAIYCPLIVLGDTWGGWLCGGCDRCKVLGGSYCKGNSGSSSSSSVTAAPSPKIIRVDFHTERQSVDKVEQIYAGKYNNNWKTFALLRYNIKRDKCFSREYCWGLLSGEATKDEPMHKPCRPKSWWKYMGYNRKFFWTFTWRSGYSWN